MSAWRRLRAGTIAVGMAVLAVAGAFALPGGDIAPSAWAQGGWWPWSSDDRRPPRPIEPREPVYRGPQPPPPWGAQTRQPDSAPQTGNSICLQLEQRLVVEGQRGAQGRDAVPRIEGEMRQLDRDLRTAQAQLDRSDCFETWLFSRTLRRTRQCVDMANRTEDLRRKLSDLDIQRQQIMGGQGTRSMQDEIIRELARNNCGATYQQEARRRGDSFNPFSSLWQDEDSGPGARPPTNQFGALPYATYRTLCVRLCDGYYFPVSFATLPNHFPRDAEVCQSKCAAPAELYYHQNPGGAVEQMVSVGEQKPYTSLRNAFRHRKEYVKDCSCKQAEYKPSSDLPGERKAEAPVQQRAAPASAPATQRR
jgi:Protein of unknown function (DUF2865)